MILNLSILLFIIILKFQLFNSNYYNKRIADNITIRIISSIRNSTTYYGLYLRDNDDPNLKEIKDLFDGYVKQSRILNTILYSKNKNYNNELEVIYTEDGKLNVSVLP
jgi:hypothetical protein